MTSGSRHAAAAASSRDMRGAVRAGRSSRAVTRARKAASASTFISRARRGRSRCRSLVQSCAYPIAASLCFNTRRASDTRHFTRADRNVRASSRSVRTSSRRSRRAESRRGACAAARRSAVSASAAGRRRRAVSSCVRSRRRQLLDQRRALVFATGLCVIVIRTHRLRLRRRSSALRQAIASSQVRNDASPRNPCSFW